MKHSEIKRADRELLVTLSDFRYELRKFLHFSEQASLQLGLQPQQHQLLLQIAGTPVEVQPTVSYLAERLGLRHHTVVELSKRCEEAGLVLRESDEKDGRSVVLHATQKGQALLLALSADHVRELHELAPKTIRALNRIRKTVKKIRLTGVDSVNAQEAAR